MTTIRPIAGLFLLTSVLTGCAVSGFPDIKSSYSSASQDAQWPSFLPMENVLRHQNIADQAQTLAGINSLQSRAIRLKNRAKLLRRPVVQGYEHLRLQQAASQLQP